MAEAYRRKNLTMLKPLFQSIVLLPMNDSELKQLLNERADFYNRPDFIPNDPIAIPHRFNQKEDIEIAGFFAAILAWGRRDLILKSCGKLLDLMQNAPLDFVMHASDAEIANLQKFVYRTFNGHDLVDFVLVLRRIYTTHGGLEAAFSTGTDTCERLAAFRILFATYAVQPHTLKHIADITTGSAEYVPAVDGAQRQQRRRFWPMETDIASGIIDSIGFALGRNGPKTGLTFPKGQRF